MPCSRFCQSRRSCGPVTQMTSTCPNLILGLRSSKQAQNNHVKKRLFDFAIQLHEAAGTMTGVGNISRKPEA